MGKEPAPRRLRKGADAGRGVWMPAEKAGPLKARTALGQWGKNVGQKKAVGKVFYCIYYAYLLALFVTMLYL